MIRQPGFWLAYLEFLETKRESMTDLAMAQRLFTQARRIVQAGDLSGLQQIVIQLNQLLPRDQRGEAPSSGAFHGTIAPD